MAKWTDKDLKFLKENYQDMESGEIASKLGRSVGSVQWKAHNIGLSKMPEWTREELSIIENNYPQKGPSWCAEKIKNRSLLSVKFKAQELGLQVNKPDRSNSGRKKSRTLTQNQVSEIARLYCGSILYNYKLELDFLSDQEKDRISSEVRKQAYIILNGRKKFDTIEEIIDWVID